MVWSAFQSVKLNKVFTVRLLSKIKKFDEARNDRIKILGDQNSKDIEKRINELENKRKQLFDEISETPLFDTKGFSKNFIL